MVDDNISLAKLIINFKSRTNYDADLLEQMGYSKAKSKAIETAAKSSRGADSAGRRSFEDYSTGRRGPAPVFPA